MFGMVFLFGLQRHFEMVPVWAQVSLPFVWSQTKAWIPGHTQMGSFKGHWGLSWCVSCSCWNWTSWVAFRHLLSSFRCSDPHLSKVWFLMRKSGVLTLRGWPGRASWVSPEPWQSSPAPSSSGSQLPSGEDSLPPWSCERGEGRKGKSGKGHLQNLPSQRWTPAHLWARWAVPKASLT